MGWPSAAYSPDLRGKRTFALIPVMGGVIGEVDALPIKGCDFEWKIKDIFSYSEEDDEYYFFSPTFSFNSASWCIVIHPNAGSDGNTPGCIDLRLITYDYHPPIKLDFSLCLKTAYGLKYRDKHYIHVFDPINYKSAIHRMISRSELLARKTELAPEGILTVVCTIRYLRSTKDASVDCTLGSSFILHQHKAFQDFKELFLKKEGCDVIIKVKGQEFPAHGAILRARSPVFASTYRYDTKEKETGIIDIEDCEPSTFSDFLCFLYCGNPDIVSIENVFSLFTAADKYDVGDLRTKCVKFMKENLSIDIFCDTIALALQHSETELITLATDFFTKHALDIVKTVKWQLFAISNPTQSNELIIKALATRSSNE